MNVASASIATIDDRISAKSFLSVVAAFRCRQDTSRALVFRP